MITNIPRAKDFEANGLAFLNLAWESVLGLSRELSESGEYQAKHYSLTKKQREKLEAKFWQQRQPALAVAVALAHQGAEFLLKAQITRVSPFLLISGDLSKWPAHRNSISKSFADFRTVDAQDLPRLHDGVCPSPMPDVFRDRFEELRKLRNTVMHSVDTSRPFTVHDGVVAVLEISDALFGATSWHKRRKAYVDGQVNHWDPFGFSDFNPAYPFAKETLHVVDEILEPWEVIQFYGFDPKQRRYICRGCEETHADDRIRSCLLTPKGAATTTIVCFCCFESLEVVRRDCTVGKCKGNVLDPDDYDYCLTCGEYP